MINYKEFEVIRTLLKAANPVPEISKYVFSHVHYYTFKSQKEVEGLVSGLIRKGFISNGRISDSGYAEIESLKVKNAIILAAGGSDISAKSVYSQPKGLFIKGGETLIERQIRQLREAGINDITVVVGYKQELYFFLAKKWNVDLIVNPNLSKNNIYSLWTAANKLGSTYICNCDNYFEDNPFSKYEYNSFHATVFKQDAKNELLVKKNSSGRILALLSGLPSGECIYGHAYINNEFTRRFIQYLSTEIEDFRVSQLFWEEFVARHADDLDMYAREYSADFLYEFDTIQELQSIEGLFLGNVSALISSKICMVLDCDESAVKNVVILQKGLSNILFTFIVDGAKYIFRYPGDSTSFFIYRKNEVQAQKLAAQSGSDNTYVYIDEDGIKISKYIEGAKDLTGIYYKDLSLMKNIAKLIRKFHDAGSDLYDWEEFNYNPMEQTKRLFDEASKMKGDLYHVFKDEWQAITEIFEYTERDGIKKTMCHNDLNQDNILLTENSLDLIDWEFAGWNDPAYDFGRIIGGYDFDDPDVDEILAAYFGRKATAIERLHWIAYVGIHSWYYVGWALYKESIGESSRDWMIFFYKQVHKVSDYVLPKYAKLYNSILDSDS